MIRWSNKPLTPEIYVQRATIKHNHRYDYSKVVYKNAVTKICITCTDHGDFFQNPANHLNGQGCPQCRDLEKRNRLILSRDEFIKRALNIHGAIYDYSKSIYVDGRSKTCISCPVHGEFFQIASDHLNGSGCPSCAAESRKIRIPHQMGYTAQMHFLKKAERVWQKKYDYSKTAYVNAKKKITIICPTHGEFYQLPDVHLNALGGCPECGREKCDKARTSNKDEFVRKAILLHGTKYSYSKVNYKKSHTKVCITCPEHGDFFQTPNQHLRNHGCGQCHISRGEEAIKLWFDRKNIHYHPQYKFADLVGKKGIPLIFDFFIPEKNLLVEYDGMQHDIPLTFGQIPFERAIENFNNLKRNDNLKNEYCIKKAFSLLRISYRDFKNIPGILAKNIEGSQK